MIEKLANVIAEGVRKANETNGKARRGVYQDGFVTTDIGTFSAVKAVPVALYNGAVVWVQISDSNTAVIIGK